MPEFSKNARVACWNCGRFVVLQIGCSGPRDLDELYGIAAVAKMQVCIDSHHHRALLFCDEQCYQQSITAATGLPRVGTFPPNCHDRAHRYLSVVYLMDPELAQRVDLLPKRHRPPRPSSFELGMAMTTIHRYERHPELICELQTC